MSGLQSSISTHIAREYFWPEVGWGTNIPLFVKAVGSHPDRLNNLYFTFLVMLRAISKAQDALLAVDYNTGNPQVWMYDLVSVHLCCSITPVWQDDWSTRALIGKLLSSKVPLSEHLGTTTNDSKAWLDAVEMCRKGFDESNLFQVRSTPSDIGYFSQLQEKEQLRIELREKCVSFYLPSLNYVA